MVVVETATPRQSPAIPLQPPPPKSATVVLGSHADGCQLTPHQAHPGQRRAEQSPEKASAQAPCPPPAHAPGRHSGPDDGSHHHWPVPIPGANGLGEHWTAALKPLDSRVTGEEDQLAIPESATVPGTSETASARKLTSLRAIEREMGIHRATIKRYLDAEGPPTRQSRAGPTTPSSDTMPA